MPQIHRLPHWRLTDRQPTDESFVVDRRSFVATLGAAGVVVGGGLIGCDASAAEPPPGADQRPVPPGLYPARRNAKYKLDRKITQRDAVLQTINYYEFDASNKPRAVELAQKLTTHPWTVEVTGLVKTPKKFDIAELEKRFGLEERLYRHRCVETWAMAVPWTGFPLSKLLDVVEPLSAAKFVRLVTYMRPKEAPGQHPDSSYPWPYHEGLRMDEARNELTMLATGLFGKPLPKQNGSPIRLVVPWKYGYKSIKAIVKIELVDKRPPTFWNTVRPAEYGFLSNVDPKVPHPRWSQAEEWMIDGGRTKKRPTLPYNGYGELVAGMYK